MQRLFTNISLLQSDRPLLISSNSNRSLTNMRSSGWGDIGGKLTVNEARVDVSMWK
jgi:hypothetical protein